MTAMYNKNPVIHRIIILSIRKLIIVLDLEEDEERLFMIVDAVVDGLGVASSTVCSV